MSAWPIHAGPPPACPHGRRSRTLPTACAPRPRATPWVTALVPRFLVHTSPLSPSRMDRDCASSSPRPMNTWEDAPPCARVPPTCPRGGRVRPRSCQDCPLPGASEAGRAWAERLGADWRTHVSPEGTCAPAPGSGPRPAQGASSRFPGGGREFGVSARCDHFALPTENCREGKRQTPFRLGQQRARHRLM